MGRKRKDENERKETMTIRIKKKYIVEIRKKRGYIVIIEKLIEDYIKNDR